MRYFFEERVCSWDNVTARWDISLTEETSLKDEICPEKGFVAARVITVGWEGRRSSLVDVCLPNGRFLSWLECAQERGGYYT